MTQSQADYMKMQRFIRDWRPSDRRTDEMLAAVLTELRDLRASFNGTTSQKPADLVTLKEAQSLLRISRSHLYALMERGDVPYVMVGRARRIARKDLDQFVAAQRRG